MPLARVQTAITLVSATDVVTDKKIALKKPIGDYRDIIITVQSLDCETVMNVDDTLGPSRNGSGVA